MTRSRPIPRPHYPAAIERHYAAQLVAFVRALRKIMAAEMQRTYAEALAERNLLVKVDSRGEELRQDAWWSDLIASAVSAISLRDRTPMTVAQRLVRRVSEQVSRFSQNDWRRLAEAQASVNLFKSEPWLNPMLEDWSRSNAQLISSIEQRYREAVADRASDMVRQGQPPAAFAKELERQYELTRSRARLIARTETSKLNGQISKARSQALGLDVYVWSTSKDERVRASHKVLQGKVCSYRDPTVYKDDVSDKEWKKRTSLGAYEGDPGQDFQCRCVGAAVIDLEAMLG